MRVTVRRGAVALIISVVVWIGSMPTASAIVPYADRSFQCEGARPGGAVLGGFANPWARTTWAHWGVSDYAYGGRLYASTKVTVLYLDQGFGGPPLVDRSVPRGLRRKLVTCRVPYSGATAKVVFRSPAPPAPPPSILPPLAGQPAPAGRYRGWVVRSLSPYLGCIVASPRGDDDVIRRFCLPAPQPALWDVVDVNYDPAGTSKVVVRGTLIRLKGM